MARSFRFRSYLSKAEPNYRIFIKKKKDERRWWGSTFGVIDEKADSIAVIEGHNLVGYGSPKAANILLGSYRNWTKASMPAGVCFDLTVYRSGDAPRPRARQWLEHRGPCEFLWSLGDEMQ